MKLFDYQKRLLDDENKRIFALWGRITGKSLTSALYALKFMKSHSDTVTLIICPTVRMTQIVREYVLRNIKFRASIFESIKSFVRHYMLRGKRTIGRTRITWDNHSMILLLPARPNSLRGCSIDLLIIDDANLANKEIFDIAPLMVAAKNGRIVVFGTGSQTKTPYYDFFHENFKFGASLHNIRTCANPLLSDQYLEELKKTTPLIQFKQEFDAEFVEEIKK